jgi:hypothetical protein
MVFPEFEGARRVLAVDEREFAAVAKPEGGVRVGAVFRARGTEGPMGEWRDVVDVTEQARAAAKAALYGAVAPRLDEPRGEGSA